METVHCPHSEPYLTRIVKAVVFQLCAQCVHFWDRTMLIHCGHPYAHHLLVCGKHEWLLCDECQGAFIAQARQREEQQIA